MTIRYYDDSISNVIVESNYNALTSAYRALDHCFGLMGGYCKGLTGPVVLEYAVRKYYKSPFKSVIISKKTENQIRVFSISVGLCRDKASKKRVFGCKKKPFVRTHAQKTRTNHPTQECRAVLSKLLSTIVTSHLIKLYDSSVITFCMTRSI